MADPTIPTAVAPVRDMREVREIPAPPAELVDGGGHADDDGELAPAVVPVTLRYAAEVVGLGVLRTPVALYDRA